MATINIEINQDPVNISQNLVDDKLYTFQLISPLGAAAHYILVNGNVFPNAPPKRAHLLLRHKHVQLKVPATKSFWAWAGTEAVLVVTEAENVKPA